MCGCLWKERDNLLFNMRLRLANPTQNECSPNLAKLGWLILCVPSVGSFFMTGKTSQTWWLVDLYAVGLNWPPSASFPAVALRTPGAHQPGERKTDGCYAHPWLECSVAVPIKPLHFLEYTGAALPLVRVVQSNTVRSVKHTLTCVTRPWLCMGLMYRHSFPCASPRPGKHPSHHRPHI